MTTVMPIKPKWNIDPESPIPILTLISEMEGTCVYLAALAGTEHEDYKYIRAACDRWYKVYFKKKKEYETTKRQSEGT
jgi:hypothetical protein